MLPVLFLQGEDLETSSPKVEMTEFKATVTGTDTDGVECDLMVD